MALILAPVLLACVPHIAPATIEAVVAVESRGAPLAIFDNKTHRAWHPPDPAAAAALSRSLIARGHRVDLGLTQVDSDHLKEFGVDPEKLFEPCTNLRIGGTILAADYAAAVQLWGEGQEALRHALSAYNAGDFYRGFRNGYLARYYHLPAPAAFTYRTPVLTRSTPSARHQFAQVASVANDSVYSLEKPDISIK